MAQKPQGTFRLDAHDISEALQALDGRAGVTVNDMAQMEFRFVSALDHSKHGIPNLERQIGESPSCTCRSWRCYGNGATMARTRPNGGSRTRKGVAPLAPRCIGYFEQMRRIPGTDADGKIVTNALMDWLTQVRALAAQYGRAEITDQCLGQLLAKAPAREHGSLAIRSGVRGDGIDRLTRNRQRFLDRRTQFAWSSLARRRWCAGT